MNFSLIKHIPNLITLLNLVCGCLAVYCAFAGVITHDYQMPLYYMLAASVFDFLDGMAARLLNAHSETGKQLDSLADMVSFGFAPGALVVALLMRADFGIWAFAGLVIPAFSALRLAKFNIDERQTSSFLGLAVPANALFFGGLAYAHSDFLISQPYLLLAAALLLSILLVTEIPMFSLKFKNLKWRGNQTQYVFLGGAAALFAVFLFGAFAYIIVWYITVSITNNFLRAKNKDNRQ